MSNQSLNTDDQSQKKTSNKKKSSLPIGLRLILGTFKYLFIVLIVGGLIGTGYGCYFVNTMLKDAKAIDTTNIYDSLYDNSVILTSSGELLDKVYTGEGLRTTIKYQDIGQNVLDAFIAVEDKTFREHTGFNYWRLAGSIVESIQSGGGVSNAKGTSTISQQLARNIYLPETRLDRDLSRKLHEVYITIQLEQSLTKNQIIEAYLNKIFLNSNSNGIQAAAQTYFSKDAKDLDLVEAAMLAGVPKSPAAYAPMSTRFKADVKADDIIIDDSDEIYTLVYNKRNAERFKTVISLMYKNGKISDAEKKMALSTDLSTKLNPSKSKATEISSYSVDMIKEDVIQALMKEKSMTRSQASNMLYAGGLQIYSTIDVSMQKKLESVYNTVNFTSYFGETTRVAVKGFQKTQGLSVDGVVGKNTLTKLLENTKYTLDDFAKNNYKKGMESDDIVLIKSVLKEKGFYSNSEKFPKVAVHMDKDENIISEETKKLVLYKYSNLVNSDGELRIPAGDFSINDKGDLILYRGNRLNFYTHYEKDADGKSTNKIDRIQLAIKDSYVYNEDSPENIRNRNGSYSIVDLYKLTGRDILVPDQYKRFDDDKNVIISRDLIKDSPNFYRVEDNNLYFDVANFVISEKGIIQPQSAMVIIDYRTGHLKAVVGGRNVTGQKIYNRAIQPQQPGSSIKPIGPYSVAIESKEWTAASVIDDVPSYMTKDPKKRWPVNWYEYYSNSFKYRGLSTLRTGIEQSINTLAVKLSDQVGIENIITHLKKLGITSIVESGNVNDFNLSAVSLGGMSKGISPYELASAYGAYANQGVQVDTITFTKILDSNGNVILENTPIKTKVVDEDVAFIIHDMIHSGVTVGLSGNAKITSDNKGIPVAGKTGTTSDKMDAVFVGYTPYYVASVWFGNDVRVPLDQGSVVAAKFWSSVMTELHEGYEDKDFAPAPENIIRVVVDNKSGKRPSDITPANSKISEYFIKGTQPAYDEIDDVHVLATVCKESGKLINEYHCPPDLVEERVFIQRQPPYYPDEELNFERPTYPIKDDKDVLPTELCDIHPGADTTDLNKISNPDNIPRLVSFPDGKRIVQIPLYLTLRDGSYVLVPIWTEILIDNTITFPNGKVITPDMYDIVNLENPTIPDEILNPPPVEE